MISTKRIYDLILGIICGKMRKRAIILKFWFDSGHGLACAWIHLNRWRQYFLWAQMFPCHFKNLHPYQQFPEFNSYTHESVFFVGKLLFSVKQDDATQTNNSTAHTFGLDSLSDNENVSTILLTSTVIHLMLLLPLSGQKCHEMFFFCIYLHWPIRRSVVNYWI